MQATEAQAIESAKEARSLLKLVHVGILISLLWKVRFYWYSVGINAEFPLSDPFFPAVFQSQSVLIAAYVLAVLGSVLTLVSRSKVLVFVLGCVSLAGLSVLCLHQNSYNDVTFLTCGWTSLWCLWLVSRLGEDFSTLYPRAAWMSHMILSVIFLGAAIGKMTPGYWSGEVIHEIYFRGRDFWTYNLLRESMSEEALRNAATWHSRMVVISEFVCAFLWLMPRKLASVMAVVVLCGIALTNNLSLFSVVACLIGLSIVGLHDSSPHDASAA